LQDLFALRQQTASRRFCNRSYLIGGVLSGGRRWRVACSYP